MDIDQFQARIQVNFKQPQLLEQALTHRSYVNEQVDEEVDDNERLEFLGDAILDYVTADLLYNRFPEMPEGQMTRLRAALVRTESLAQFAIECGLGEALRIGKGEANSGGRYRNNNLCSGFEAVVGAIYLDQGLEAVKAFIIPQLTEMQGEVMDEALRKDPRSQFQEWAQAEHSVTPKYRTLDSSGPDHDKRFTVSVSLRGVEIAQGKGRSKRAGAQSAAAAALELREAGTIVVPPPPPEPEPIPEETPVQEPPPTTEDQSQ